MKPRAVVVFAGAIGDTILAAPALELLSREFTLDLVGYPGRLELLTQAGIGARARSLDASGFSSLFTRPDTAARDLLADAARTIVFMRDPNGQLAKAIAERCTGSVKLYEPLPPQDWTGHASDYYGHCLGYPLPTPPFRLELSPESCGCDIILHPGSGSARKNWPLEYVVDLARALADLGYRIGYTAGPAEEDLTLPGVTRLPECGLITLARRLASARLFIGNDSGITHLAAAAGCRTIAIFGPTDPRVWAPRGDHVTVLQGTPWPTVDTVLQCALRERSNPPTW